MSGSAGAPPQRSAPITIPARRSPSSLFSSSSSSTSNADDDLQADALTANRIIGMASSELKVEIQKKPDQYHGLVRMFNKAACELEKNSLGTSVKSFESIGDSRSQFLQAAEIIENMLSEARPSSTP